MADSEAQPRANGQPSIPDRRPGHQEPLISVPNLFTCVLALSLTLVRVSNTYSKSITTALVLLVLVACILWAIPRQRRNVFLTGSAVLVFVFALDIALALIRGAEDHAYSNLPAAIARISLYLAAIALGMVSLTSARDVAERDRRLVAIALAPVIYALTNGILSLGGVQAPPAPGASVGTLGAVGSQSQLLGLLGIAGARVQFPLASSVNLYSIIASAGFAALAVLRIRAPERLPRKIAWPGMAVCVFEVLIGDSRATLAVALVILLVFVIRRRFAGSSIVALLIPLFPLIVIGLLDLIGSTSIGSLLGRAGGAGQNDLGSVSTGSGRIYIWRGIWQVLRHFNLHDVIGWGAAGQIPSGASLRYLFVFPHDKFAYAAFAHNLTLQVILDEGYVGLLILVAVLARTSVLLKRHLRDEPRSPAVALVAMLLVFILSGATEVSPTYYTEEVLIMTFLIAGAASALVAAPRARGSSSSGHEEEQTRRMTGVAVPTRGKVLV